MKNTIHLGEEEVVILKDYYESRNKTLRSEIRKLEEIISNIKADQLGEAEFVVIIEYLESRKKMLKSEVREKTSKISKIKEEVNDLDMKLFYCRSNMPGHVDVPRVYHNLNLSQLQTFDKNWNWNEKIWFTMFQSKQPLTTKEIVEGLVGHEPELNLKKVTKGVYVTLSRGVQAGLYHRVVQKGEKNRYVLPTYRTLEAKSTIASMEQQEP